MNTIEIKVSVSFEHFLGLKLAIFYYAVTIGIVICFNWDWICGSDCIVGLLQY